MSHRSSSADVTPTRESSRDNSQVINWILGKSHCASKSRKSLRYSKARAGSQTLYRSLVGSEKEEANEKTRANAHDPQSTGTNWNGHLNKTWKVYKVSPLYLFSFRPSSLQLYSKLLAAHLEAATTNSAVFVENQVGNVRIQASKNKDMIEVFLMQKQRNGSAEVKVLLTAIFYTAKADVDKLHKSFTLLPLLLAKGPANLVAHLIEWWQVQFDSCVTQFIFSPLQLMWMVAVFRGTTTEGQHSKPVEFVYKMPEEIEGLSTITYSINAFDCQRIWQSICGNQGPSDICTSEQVMSFISAWNEHFHYYFGVHLQALRLYTIGTPVLHISNEGLLKIYSADYVQQVLAYLTEEALKQNIA